MNRLPLLNEGVGSYQGIGDTYVQSRLGGHSTYSFSMTALKWSEGENYVALSPYGIRLPGLRYPNGHRRIDRRISVCEAATAGRTSLGSRLDRRQQLDPNCRRDLCTVVQIDRSYISTIECPDSRKPVELITAHAHTSIAGAYIACRFVREREV